MDIDALDCRVMSGPGDTIVVPDFQKEAGKECVVGERVLLTIGQTGAQVVEIEVLRAKQTQ